ncbi:tail tube GTA-gp10-like protein [Palleronia aestuarii]|uniref:Tail tube GTA-gp10-like protein n=1 Tax=Palleronia aestuarii TaxID=568105 RepID=A0A2W7NIX1_9RHOB|nr:gene transfer agent family protein [Palleronia aestuarii]PZX19820.1 tail tube GTA-gp10-like protein [Palleronia aestuarii]
MADLIAEWAGKDRLFRLTFGGVLDLEEACGKDAIGAIFLRVTTGTFRVTDVYQVIRMALIGGGENRVEAKRLMETHFDAYPYTDNAALAGEILMALMTGIEDVAKTDSAEVPEPWKFSEASQICRTFHMSPQDLRDLSYADFVNMIAGFNAASPQKAEPPTEEEFDEILAKYEPGALK